MKKVILFLILSQVYLIQYGQIIADHTVVDKFDDIPQEYINKVKEMWLVHAGESHSLALRNGLLNLETIDPKFAVSVVESGTPEAYTTNNLRASRATWGNYSNTSGWIYSYGEEDWYSNTTAPIRTKAGITYCNTNNLTIGAMGFGWCWDPAEHTTSDFNMYIDATEQYIAHCKTMGYPTKIYFTTGTVDIYYDELGYEKYLGNEMIRDHVNAGTDRILFDYADILCYDEGSETPNTYTWSGHAYPIITNTNLNPVTTGHISSKSALRLAKAMWWMLARMSGWDGGTTYIPVTGITVTGAGGSSAITTDNSTLQLSAAIVPTTATNQTVTWTIANGTGQATISSTGLVTAISNGTVTARATANDGTGVSGTSIITLSNQVILEINTLGNTTVYGSTSILNNRRATPVTFSEDGTIESISIYHNGGSGGVLLGVYSDASSAPSSRLGVTASTTVSSTSGWQAIPLTSAVSVTSGQTVWLAWVFQTSPGTRYTTGTPSRAESTATWSGSIPTTFGTASYEDYKYSVYCTYTPGPPTPYLNVSPATVSLGSASGSSGTFNIISNTTWSVTDNGDWLSVSPVSGTNNGTITCTATSENVGTSPRSATVTVAGTGVTSRTLTVTQEGFSTSKTLGNTEVYGSTSTLNNRRAIPVTFSEDGTIESISIYHNGGSGGVVLGVYSGANSTPSSLLAVTTSTTVSSTAGWQTISLTSVVSVTAGQTVWLAWVFQTSPGTRYTTGTPSRAESTTTWSGGMPATFGTAAYANYKYSVYCNYIPEDTGSKTLGNMEVYGSTSTLNNRRTIPVTFSEDGSIESISIYHNGGSGGVMLGVYSDASSDPSSRLGVTASTTVSSMSGWQTILLTSTVSVTSGQTVWLAWVFQTIPGTRYMTGAPARAESTATWSGGMPTTFGTVSYDDYKYSVYCKYVPTSENLLKSEGNPSGNNTTDIITEEVVIYPNPTDGNITIKWNNNYDSGLMLTIYNALGSLVKKVQVQPHINEVNIDLNDTQPGIYLLQLRNNLNGITINTSRVIKN